jgi:hypothetical protein
MDQYLLNIMTKTHEAKLSKHKYDGCFTHTIYNHEDFTDHGYSICDASYEKDKRFNVFKILH